MAKTNPFEFLQQVRSEASKVTWPTRKETTITTAMVFVMAVLASVFFLVVDQIIGWGVRTILGLGGGRPCRSVGISSTPTRTSRTRLPSRSRIRLLSAA
jgi:preprotein translocase subunit SecE